MSTEYVLIGLVPLLAGLVACGLTPLAARFSFFVGAVDYPDARRVHSRPMPRLGGIAVIFAVVAGLTLAGAFKNVEWALPNALFPALMLGLLPILVISILDDIRPRSARLKLVCHIAGAVIAVAGGISLPRTVHVLGFEYSIGIWAAPISIFWLTGVTNAFNIIDGLDGLAAGLAFISAAAVSAVFLANGQISSAVLPLALAGSLAGFLPFNFYPARVFLGDTGATAIGFALAAISLDSGATISAGFATATPLLILGLPLADTAVAIMRRLERWAEHRVGGIFQADRNHVHHRLLALGLNHRQAVLFLHGLGCITAAVAFLSMFLSNRDSALLLFGLLVAASIGLRRLGYDEFAVVRRGTILRFYEARVLRRALFIAFVDVAFVCASVYLAIGLKTDDWALQSSGKLMLRATALLVPLSVIVFCKAKLYEGPWRLATINDYARASLTCGLVVAIACVLCAWRFQEIPISLLIVYGLIDTFLVVGSRASYRALVEAQRPPAPGGIRTIICGSGSDDVLIAHDLIERAGSFGLRPVGFITPSGAGPRWAGLPIGGSLEELPRVARAAGATAALLARRSSPGLDERFEALCREAQVKAYRLNTELELIGNQPEIAEGPLSVYFDMPAPVDRERPAVTQ